MLQTTWRPLALMLSLFAFAAGGGNTTPSVARTNHTAVLLRDGSVLVMGGTDVNTNQLTPVVEVFRPWAGWETLSNLTTPVSGQLSHARAVMLPDGKVLYVGSGARVFNPGPNSFVDVTSNMPNVDRQDFTLTLLRNGSVLVAGGVDYSIGDAGISVIGSGAAGSWNWTPMASDAGDFLTNRWNHTATLLHNGNVLIAGGTTPITGTTRVPGYLLFDADAGTASWVDGGITSQSPSGHTATRRWGTGSGDIVLFGDLANPNLPGQLVRPLPNLSQQNFPRPGGYGVYSGHSAVLLPNGVVELSGGGGSAGGTLDQTHQLRPDGGWVTPPGQLQRPRKEHTSTLLMDGKVLVVGASDAGESGWELRDPVGFRFNVIGTSGGFGRSFATATPIPLGGELVIVGGEGASAPNAVTVLSQDGNSTSLMAPLVQRTGHTATVLPTFPAEELLVLGGNTGTNVRLNECWLISLVAPFAVKPCKPMPSPRAGHTATLLANGKLLVTGGLDQNDLPTATVWLFDPGQVNGGNWVALSAGLSCPRADHAALLLPNGEVLVTGGTGCSRKTERFNYDAGTFAPEQDLDSQRRGHTMTLLRDGRVLVAGGADNGGRELSSAEVLPVQTGSNWRPLLDDAGTNLNEGRSEHAAVALPTGDVVLAGGAANRGGSVSRFSPMDETFTVGSLTAARFAPALVLGNSGEVLVVGGQNAVNGNVESWRVAATAAALQFDPGVDAQPKQLYPGSAFTFRTTAVSLGAPEASSGDGRNSAVNLPRLVVQRLDNGEVMQLFNYTYDPQTGTFTGQLDPAFPVGVYRAWAYVAGVPGSAAWFRVGGYSTTAYIAGSDGGVQPADAGAIDGGAVGLFTVAIRLDGTDPRFTSATVRADITVHAPDGTPGSEVVLNLIPSPNLEVCKGNVCATGQPIRFPFTGAFNPAGVTEPYQLRPLADAPLTDPHHLRAEVLYRDRVASATSVSFASVPPDLATDSCGGGCSAAPGSLLLAAVWMLVRGRRRR